MLSMNKTDFFQSKYEYYREFSLWVTVFSCIASVSYFISDCQIFGRFAYETLIPRCMAFVTMFIFIIIYKYQRSYKIMVPITYLALHSIMWNTIWAIVYLPNKDFAREGFIIMHLMFFAIGFCAPIKYAIIAHSLLIVDILVSYIFIRYETIDMMLSLGIPCVVSICAAHYFMQKLFNTHYQTAKKLEYISTYDTLTDIYNRNILDFIIDKDTLLFSKDLGENIYLLLFDIDFFKQVNDTYGHTAGDQILKNVVTNIKRVLIEPNYFIRWGGEEFVIIIPDCTEEKAQNIAERIRNTIENSTNGICHVTISIGVTHCDLNDTYITSVNKADNALYIAKRSGRNCIYFK